MGYIVGNTLVLLLITLNLLQEYSYSVHTRAKKISARALMENSYCNFVNVKRRRNFLQEKGRSLIETTPTTGLELLPANESHHLATAQFYQNLLSTECKAYNAGLLQTYRCGIARLIEADPGGRAF